MLELDGDDVVVDEVGDTVLEIEVVAIDDDCPLLLVVIGLAGTYVVPSNASEILLSCWSERTRIVDEGSRIALVDDGISTTTTEEVVVVVVVKISSFAAVIIPGDSSAAAVVPELP